MAEHKPKGWGRFDDLMKKLVNEALDRREKSPKTKAKERTE